MTEFRKTKRVKQHNPVQLSQPEINFLLSGMSTLAQELQSEIKDARHTKGLLWEKCVPDTPVGSAAFERFSAYRTFIKEMRVDLKRVESIIRKLKSQR